MKLIARGVLLLLPFLLLLAFVACTPADSPSDDAPDLPPAGSVMLSDLSSYTIVRADGLGLSAKNQVFQLKKNLYEFSGTDPQSLVCTDAEVGAFEILVGATDRPESKELLDSLRYRDYGYALINGKFVIGAHSEENLELAIQKFRDEVLVPPAEDGVLMTPQSVLVQETYASDDMTIYGLPCKGLTVVYPERSPQKVLAERLAQVLSEQSGYFVSVTSSQSVPESGNLLLLGVSARGLTLPGELGNEDGFFAKSSDAVLFCGGSTGFALGCRTLLSQAVVCNSASIPLPAEGVVKMGSDLVRIRSFNVLVSKRTDQRIASVKDAIGQTMPDSLGLQEASSAWIKDLAAAFPEYAVVGVGRGGSATSGDTEGTYMLYLKDKYTLLESGTRWLSDTPAAPSAYPESKYNRTYTYLMLQRKSDGKIFVHVNTHLDHTSATAREKQVAVLIAEMERFSDYPVLVTGDFNSDKTSAVWKAMQDKGYVDSSLVADTAETGITFHNYGSASAIIDFCFVTDDRLQVSYYKVITEAFNGMRPSDHNPLFVDVMLP